ncbi:MAG: right-handed parallel beta-helix repeat-containing protein [Thermoflexales bacterium]|nr:right-handed parallel beta-helix repeat-containing protein [Thermoflexales bacterium]
MVKVLVALTLALATLSGAPAKHTKAGPYQPAAGTFTVNSELDTNSADSVLTLREAILIANGGTSAGGLGRALTAGEAAQLSFCTISGGLITAGCGAGSADWILYSAGITRTVLSATLPPLSDNGTTLWPSSRIELDFLAASGPDSIAIAVYGSDITLANLTIVNVANPITAVYVSGLRAVLRENFVGTRPNVSGCGTNNVAARPVFGIMLTSKVTAGADANHVFSNTIGCATYSGINVVGSDFTRIGMDLDNNPAPNWIGVSGDSELPVPNGTSGIALSTTPDLTTTRGVRSTDIAYNVIAGNGTHGIILTGSGTNDTNSVALNTIRANYIGYRPHTQTPLGNNIAGILLTNGAYQNVIGGATAADANIITGHPASGIIVSNSNRNGILGNSIGVHVPYTTALGNGAFGVYIDNGANNLVGGFNLLGMSVRGNRIGNNGLAGVHIVGGTNNQVIANEIGSDNGAPRGNLGYGVRLIGAVGTRVGSNAVASWGNTISNNANVAVSLEGVTQTLVAGNVISGNLSMGVGINFGAVYNTIGAPTFPNTITLNGYAGIFLGRAANNLIHYNTIEGNEQHGVEMSLHAISNTITSTVITNNGLDGISIEAGALYNNWSRLSVFGNGGLGVDRDAVNGYNIPDAGALTVDAAVYVESQTKVVGRATPSTGAVTTRIELYAPGSPRDPSGYGEGLTYLGSTVTDATGNWSLLLAGHQSCVTAIETVITAGVGAQSGEFAFNRCVGTWLPVISR